jgi:cytochrome b pre-mRNA-processing protein 3
MSTRRLSTLWAREICGSQNLCLSRSASRSPITLVSASWASTEQPLKSVTTRSYSQSKVSDLAKNFSRRPGNAAETYVAYGMTQKLFEACSSQADYKIPQASQKGAEVPKTEAGEDLGVGEGWWYKGKRSLAVSGLGYDLV